MIHHQLNLRNICVLYVYVGLGIFPWAYMKRKISCISWRLTSSGDLHQIWDEYHEDIICLKFSFHLVIMDFVDTHKRVSLIVEYKEQFTSLHRASEIKKGNPIWGGRDRPHLALADYTQGKGMIMIILLFHWYHDISWETGLYDK